nr:hypothetical protein [uncultured Aminipila sp.]
MRSVNVLQEPCIPQNQLQLMFQSKIIWRDLSTWIRAYLASKHGGLGDKEAVRYKLDELLIQSVNIFSLIFGEQSADQYVSYSSNFINNLDFLVDAQIDGDTDAVNEYTKLLNENSEQTAAFLAEINPYWSESKWKDLLYQFNHKTIDQSTTFFNKEFKENIDIFNRILILTSTIGDHYSQGIVDYLAFSNRKMSE